MKLTKWYSAPNYMGEDYSDYYVLIAKTRDSDALERSNFCIALDMLGGESKKVIVVRFNHWGVGWIESIMIHETATDKLKIAEGIIKEYNSYPVLDEQGYQDEQWDEWKQNYDDWAKDEASEMLGLHTPLSKLDGRRLWYAVTETFMYSGEAYLDGKTLIEKWQEALDEVKP